MLNPELIQLIENYISIPSNPYAAQIAEDWKQYNKMLNQGWQGGFTQAYMQISKDIKLIQGEQDNV